MPGSHAKFQENLTRSFWDLEKKCPNPPCANSSKKNVYRVQFCQRLNSNKTSFTVQWNQHQGECWCLVSCAIVQDGPPQGPSQTIEFVFCQKNFVIFCSFFAIFSTSNHARGSKFVPLEPHWRAEAIAYLIYCFPVIFDLVICSKTLLFYSGNKIIELFFAFFSISSNARRLKFVPFEP